MYAASRTTRTAQQFICMTLATLIVAASLALGAYGAHTLADPGYTITITQL